MASSIHSVNIPDGGVPKLPVAHAMVTELGLLGDRQRNRRYHGGPDRAVCLFSIERIEELVSEGHPVSSGSIGENITVRGLDWDLVVPGVRLRVGQGRTRDYGLRRTLQGDTQVICGQWHRSSIKYGLPGMESSVRQST